MRALAVLGASLALAACWQSHVVDDATAHACVVGAICRADGGCDYGDFGRTACYSDGTFAYCGCLSPAPLRDGGTPCVSGPTCVGDGGCAGVLACAGPGALLGCYCGP